MKKLILLLLFIPFLSCNQDIKNKVTKEINSSQIPAVVMGKIDKNGNMEFFSNGPSRWDRNDTINENNNTLKANSSDAEYTSTAYGIDLLSNGFKPYTSDGNYNANGDTYIYMAFGQSLVGSNNVPCTAR